MKKMTFLMRFPLLLAVMLLGVQDVAAQGNKYNCPETLFPEYDNHKKLWGYKNIKGEWAVPPTFTEAAHFEDRNAIIKKNKHFGVINCSGYMVVPPKYERILGFNSGQGWAKKNGKWGLIDDRNRPITGHIYPEIKPLSDRGEYMWVKKEGKWGLYHSHSKRYKVMPKFETVLAMSDSASIVRKGNKFGVISHLSGGYILPLKLEAINKIGFQHYTYLKDDHWGLVNAFGRVLLRGQYDTIFVNSRMFQVEKNGKYGLVGLRGKMVADTVYQEIGKLRSGLFRVKKGGHYGFITKEGKQVVEHRFDYAEDLKDLRIIAANQGRFGVFNPKTKKFVIPQQHDRIFRNYAYDFFFIRNQGQFTIHNLEGKQVMDFRFDTIYYQDPVKGMRVRRNGHLQYLNLKVKSFLGPHHFDSGRPFQGHYYTVATQEGKKGVIDTLGQWVLKPEFSQIALQPRHAQMYFKVKQDGLYGLYNQKNIPVIPPDYQLLDATDFRYMKVKKEGQFGIRTKEGEWVVEPQYDFLSTRQNAANARPWPAIIRDGNKWGLLSKRGKELVMEKWDSLRYGGAKRYFIYEDQQVGLLAANGEVFKKPQFQALRPYDKKRALAAAKKDGKWGFVNPRGNWVIENRYDEVTPFVQKATYVRRGEKWGALDQEGETLLPLEYDGYRSFGEGKRRLYKAKD